MAIEAKYADIDTLPNRQEITIEVQKEGEAVTVIYKELHENGDGEAVTVGTLPKAIPLLVRARASRELVILDGAKILFRSLDGGDSWEAL